MTILLIMTIMMGMIMMLLDCGERDVIGDNDNDGNDDDNDDGDDDDDIMMG